MTPPGLGISRLLEDELRTNFSVVDMGYLEYNLEKAIVEGLEMAKTFRMEASGSNIQVEIGGNIFDEIFEDFNELHLLRKIGDPLSSALACIFTRVTRRPIAIKTFVKRDKDIKVSFKQV